MSTDLEKCCGHEILYIWRNKKWCLSCMYRFGPVINPERETDIDNLLDNNSLFATLPRELKMMVEEYCNKYYEYPVESPTIVGTQLFNKRIKYSNYIYASNKSS
jgi:hypothetical protein